MKKIHYAIIAIILISFGLAAYLYPQMPDQMASHWNAKGEVDDTMSKCWGLYLMPGITVLMYLMFLAIPKIDPLKKNIEKFRPWFDGFILMMVIFLFYIYLLTIIWNLGHTFNMTLMILPPIGALFIYIGYFLPHAKRNWFIGIRTPWTLSSDTVWKKTHKRASWLFKTAGVLIIMSLLIEKYTLHIVIISAIVAGLNPIIYSYVAYEAETGKKWAKRLVK